MDLAYVICILLFISNDNVFSGASEDNTGQSEQIGELDHKQSQLETKLSKNNRLSALDVTTSERNANSSEGDANTSTNDESQDTLTEEYTDEAESSNVTGSDKKLVIYQWRNGIVPYYVDAHSYDIIIYLRIRKVLDAIQSASCLMFKPIPKPRSGYFFVHFTNPNKERECVHTLPGGRLREPVVVLGYDCMQERDIIHSVMHLLGFRDEVTHPRRDSYIRIMWNNIQPKYRPLFTIDTKPSWTQKLAEYDTLSVMHFHDRAFSINGGPTILPLLPDRIINPSDKLSLLDKMKLHIAFGNECNRRQVNYLVETCKNYARDAKKTKDSTAEDHCSFDKFKVTTISDNGNVEGSKRDSVQGVMPNDGYENGIQSENVKKEYLAGIVGVYIGHIINSDKHDHSINVKNNTNNKSDTVDVNIGHILYDFFSSNEVKGYGYGYDNGYGNGYGNGNGKGDSDSDSDGGNDGNNDKSSSSS